MGLSKWYVLLTILAASTIVFWAGAAITRQFGEAASLLAYVLYFAGYVIFVIALSRAQNKINLAIAE